MRPSHGDLSGRVRIRFGAALVALLATIGVVTGCSSATTAEPPRETVTISHKFGETKVPENPARVVTVGWNDQDFVLALGVVPIVTRAWFDEYDNYPWVQEATGGKGVATMGGDGIDYEAVAAAKPDVIFAVYESVDRPTYDRLSQIAPTVIQSGEYPDEETPWNVQLLLTGKALGKEAQAQALLDEVNAKIDEAKAANPAFAGKVLVEDFGPARADGPRRAVRQRGHQGTDDRLPGVRPAERRAGRPDPVHHVRLQPERRAFLQRPEGPVVRTGPAGATTVERRQRKAGRRPVQRLKGVSTLSPLEGRLTPARPRTGSPGTGGD
jgi:hypothetical protein